MLNNTWYYSTTLDPKNNLNAYWLREDTSETYPLRWLIYCESCHRAMTSIPGHGNWWKYYYYGCNRKDYPKNYSIPVAHVHKDFMELLHTMRAKPEVLLLLDSIFNETLSSKEESHKSKSKAIKEQIIDIDKRIEQKLSLIDKLSRIELIQKLEDEIWQLMQQKYDLEDRVNDKFIDDQETARLLQKYKSIIENPVAIRELWNKDLKRMLLLVLFDGKLYYNKKNGYKTILNEHIYAGLNNFFDLKILYGGTDETRTRDLSSDSAAF